MSNENMSWMAFQCSFTTFLMHKNIKYRAIYRPLRLTRASAEEPEEKTHYPLIILDATKPEST